MGTTWHVAFGNRDLHHEEELVRLAKSGKSELWTISSKAVPPSRVAFYMLGESKIVAVGRVLSTAKKQIRGAWSGMYMARVSGVAMLKSPVPRQRLLKEFPDWGWAKTPRRSTTVPSRIAAGFEALLLAAPDRIVPSIDLKVREGAPAEYRVTRRGRSRTLRAAALAGANGVCEACRTDFSTLLGGRGRHVLQVHHRRQLAASESPPVTHVKDLAVLCANCHQLVHMDRAAALDVKKLRRMLVKSAPARRRS